MIVLIPITIQNWETAASLDVDEHQRAFVRSNAWSIAESLYHPELVPLGIYRGGTMVGFVMYGTAEQDGQVWLFRLMIDKRYQGQGLGKEALQRVIRRMRDEGYTEVDVGWHPENSVAERLYLNQGFEPTGIADWGENSPARPDAVVPACRLPPAACRL
ncbi:MAG: GNAT family N-acetyltransferase [Thermomicrobiales bacterium]